jgi:hypothetical protein
MRDYSPKRRTAVVFSGTGTAGAYHAGVLKALDESGVKIDLVVGSGIGSLAAAFAAVAGGARLYSPGGFWDGLTWDSFYRVRPILRTALALLVASMLVLLLPLAVGLLLGLLSPLAIVADLALPGLIPRLMAGLSGVWHAVRIPYLAALVAPIFVLSLVSAVAFARTWARNRRRSSEALEFVLDASAARTRVAAALREVSHGAALPESTPQGDELSQRYVALLSENLGQPGFRELILRTADLETGRTLPFVLLDDAHLKSFSAIRGRTRSEGPDAVDLRQPAHQGLMFEALLAGIVAPLVTGVQRITFPKGGVFAGESHRIGDATLTAGCGIAEALAAGAEQVIVATPVPQRPAPPARRRGPRALVDAVLGTLERQSLEQELSTVERMNRMVETLGHRTDVGGRAWEDPASGRLFHDCALYVVRPERRTLQPLELSGAEDPASEVFETVADLIERGYRDTYRQFVEPVVGASAEPRSMVHPGDATVAVRL